MGHSDVEKANAYDAIRKLSANLMWKEAEMQKWDVDDLCEALLSEKEKGFCRISFALDIIDVLREDRRRDEEYGGVSCQGLIYS